MLWLISTSADRIGHITKCFIMIELLGELKNSNFQHRSVQAFDNVSAGENEN